MIDYCKIWREKTNSFCRHKIGCWVLLKIVSRAAKWNWVLVFAKIENCRSWKWAAQSGFWNKWSLMAESRSNWFSEVLVLQFRLGRTFLGFSLFQIDLLLQNLTSKSWLRCSLSWPTVFNFGKGKNSISLSSSRSYFYQNSPTNFVPAERIRLLSSNFTISIIRWRTYEVWQWSNQNYSRDIFFLFRWKFRRLEKF